MSVNLDIHNRLQRYCLYFEDYEALQSLRVNFLKNKQDLEQVTCQLSDVVHDDSKTWGEDGYYLGEKVEVKNTCFLGKTKLTGRVKFHDLSLSRVEEFRSEPYWLIIGCYNFISQSSTSCEIVYGFKIDEQIANALEERIRNGNSDPEIGLPAYEHILRRGVEENGVKIFYYDAPLTPSAYSNKLYTYLQKAVNELEEVWA